MKGKLTLALAVAMLMSCFGALAKPADPRPMTFVQPDGQKITVKLRGDERQHYFLTEDGYLLVRDGDSFYYGNVNEEGAMLSSGILARQADKRTSADLAYLNTVNMDLAMSRLQKRAESVKAPMRRPHANAVSDTPSNGGYGLFADASFPVTGHQQVLVILVSYPDVPFTLADPVEYFNDMLNQEGFSSYGGTGSVVDYFRDNSRGVFDPEFDVYGPVELPKNRSYYGANDFWGNDEHPEEMIIDACRLLNDEIDFSQYDRDHDGFIDNVYVFYAGAGEASGGNSNTIWPHSWNVTAATSIPYVFDGVQLDRYACSNEMEGQTPDGIGTFVHEFSHVMGLPDLYATSYSGAFTPGAWSALDYGPYNNDGRTPPNYSAFERNALGWMKPKVIDGPNNITLRDITYNEACIINTDRPTEFYLFENRQQEGWDKYIPGHGMLVWHVDYNEGIWSSNSVNNSSSHQYVDIVEADNTRDAASRAGDAFPGTKNVTTFTDFTTPSMLTWGGKPLGLPLTEIAETDGVITFYVAGGVPDISAVELSPATNITATSFDISWSAEPNASRYLVSVYNKLVGGRDNYKYVDGWAVRNVGDVTSVTVSGLQPETTYYCVVASANNAFVAEDSNEIEIVTGPPTFEFFSPVAIEATDVDGTSFVAHWEAMDGAQSYVLNVYTKGEPTYNIESCDFTGGVNNMPKGWTTNSKLTYANSAYSGAAIPSLRLAAADAYVSSPKLDDDVTYVKFWHRGSNAPEANLIRVKGLVASNYVEITTLQIVNDLGGATTVIDDIPAGVRGIRIEYVQNVKSGSLAIDDIEIGTSPYCPIYALEGYNPVEAGAALSCSVTGLTGETTYYYTVTAYDGEKYSKPSNEMSVTTLYSGITDAKADARVCIYGNTVSVSALPGQKVSVYDMMGREVASALTDATGAVRIALQPGIYLLRTADLTYKLKI